MNDRKRVVINGLITEDVPEDIQFYRLQADRVKESLIHAAPITDFKRMADFSNENIELKDFWWCNPSDRVPNPTRHLISRGAAKEVRELLNIPLDLMSWELVEANKLAKKFAEEVEQRNQAIAELSKITQHLNMQNTQLRKDLDNGRKIVNVFKEQQRRLLHLTVWQRIKFLFCGIDFARDIIRIHS